MLPLAAETLPPSSPELSTAIREGFSRRGIAAREVTVEGGAFPKVERLRVDLTDARATRDLRFAQPGSADGSAFEAGSLEISGAPLYFEALPLNLKITAQNAGFTCASLGEGASLLALQRAENGRLDIEFR